MGEQLDFDGLAKPRAGRRSAAAVAVKTLTVRLPESLIARIDEEARAHQKSKSDIIREWLERPTGPRISLLDELDDLEAFALMADLLSLGRPNGQPATVDPPTSSNGSPPLAQSPTAESPPSDPEPADPEASDPAPADDPPPAPTHANPPPAKRTPRRPRQPRTK